MQALREREASDTIEEENQCATNLQANVQISALIAFCTIDVCEMNFR